MVLGVQIHEHDDTHQLYVAVRMQYIKIHRASFMTEGKQTQDSLDMSGQKTCVVKRLFLFANQPPQPASETRNKHNNC